MENSKLWDAQIIVISFFSLYLFKSEIKCLGDTLHDSHRYTGSYNHTISNFRSDSLHHHNNNIIACHIINLQKVSGQGNLAVPAALAPDLVLR